MVACSRPLLAPLGGLRHRFAFLLSLLAFLLAFVVSNGGRRLRGHITSRM